jgi:hypothetical protein
VLVRTDDAAAIYTTAAQISATIFAIIAGFLVTASVGAAIADRRMEARRNRRAAALRRELGDRHFERLQQTDPDYYRFRLGQIEEEAGDENAIDRLEEDLDFQVRILRAGIALLLVPAAGTVIPLWFLMTDPGPYFSTAGRIMIVVLMIPLQMLLMVSLVPGRVIPDVSLRQAWHSLLTAEPSRRYRRAPLRRNESTPSQ